MATSTLRTAFEAKAWLERHGVTVTEWARAHGFEPSVVFALLSGRTHGKRGQAHRAAVALGLKGPVPEWELPPLADAARAEMPTGVQPHQRHSNDSPSQLTGGTAMT